MIQTAENRNVKIVKGLQNGKGEVQIEPLIGPDELKQAGRLYAKVTLKPGCSIGYHTHQAESETYYILSGEAKYDDNGMTKMLKAGDVTYTALGAGHGIENISDKDLVFIGLILFHPEESAGV